MCFIDPAEKFGLGLAAVGRPQYINLNHGSDLANKTSKQALKKQSHQLMNAAWEAGIRYFDAARSYGLAENFLSLWLRDNPVKATNITISSKWGYIYTANWNKNAITHEVKDHSVTNLKNQFKESSSLLDPHLDYYLIHSATLDSGVLNNSAVLKKLHKIKQGGIKIGMSVSGEQQSKVIEQALAITFDGAQLFDVFQVTYNLLEQSATEQMIAAKNSGAIIVAKETLANGLLSSSNHTDTTNLKKLEELAKTYTTTIDAIAMAAIAQQSFIDIVLSGACTIEQLHSNLQAKKIVKQDNFLPLLNTMQQSPQQYWHNRQQLAWQ